MKPASFENAEWIDPWRDRTPMTDDMVLATVWAGTADYRACEVMRGRLAVVCTFYDTEKKAWGVHNVLAWQPIPFPYNPVEAEEEARCEVCCEPLTDPVTVTLYPMDKDE